MYIKEEAEENAPVKIELLDLEDIKTEEMTDEFLCENESNGSVSKPVDELVKQEPGKRRELKVCSKSYNCIPKF